MRNGIELRMSRLMFLGMVLLPILADAQRRITLDEAIQLSIRSSTQLHSSQARIEEAVAATRQAYEAQLPGATASGSYLRLNSPAVDFKLKTNSSGSGSTSGSSSSSSPTINQVMYATISASLPIYAGGRIRYGIESARYLEQAARLDAANDQETIIQNTIEAYNNLYKSQTAVALVDSNLAGIRERVREYTNMEQNGILARNDLLKAQLQQSNTELSYLDAENNWRLATVNMNIMLGLPDSTQLVIDSTDMKTVSDNRPLGEFLQQALANRKDIQAVDYRLKAAQTGIKATRAESLPSIALTSGYTALNIPNAITVLNAMNIGLGVQYNIANLWKRGNVAAAKARLSEAEAGRDQLANAVHLQIVQAYNNYLLNRKKIDVYSTAIVQADENFRIVNNKFNNGLATVADVLEADVARLQAHLNRSFAVSDSYVAYNRLLQAAGLISNPKQ